MKVQRDDIKRDWFIEEALAYFWGEDVTPHSEWKKEIWITKISEASRQSLLTFKCSVGIGAFSIIVAGMRGSGIYDDFLFTVIAIAVPFGALGFIQHAYSDRHEPKHDELLRAASTTEQKRRVQALREFRRLLVEGEIRAYWLSFDGTKNWVSPELFDADNGLVLILNVANRKSILPWKPKPVGTIRVEWTPKRFISLEIEDHAEPEADCVTILEGVVETDFHRWRDDLVNNAGGRTRNRLLNLLNAMFAVASNKVRNRQANVIDQILKQLAENSDQYSRESIDKILHGTQSSEEYAYVLRYLIACKSGQTVKIDAAKRGHPLVTFIAPDELP